MTIPPAPRRPANPVPAPDAAREGTLPMDTDAAGEALHRRHQAAEAARHQPSETGAAKEGAPSPSATPPEKP